MGGFFFFPAVPYLVAVSSAGHHSVVTFHSWRSWNTLRNLVKTISVCRSVLRLTMRCDINYSPLCIDPIDLTEGNDCMAHISHRVVWAVSSVFRLTQWTNRLTAMLIPNHQGTILSCFPLCFTWDYFYVSLVFQVAASQGFSTRILYASLVTPFVALGCEDWNFSLRQYCDQVGSAFCPRCPGSATVSRFWVFAFQGQSPLFCCFVSSFIRLVRMKWKNTSLPSSWVFSRFFLTSVLFIPFRFKFYFRTLSNEADMFPSSSHDWTARSLSGISGLNPALYVWLCDGRSGQMPGGEWDLAQSVWPVLNCRAVCHKEWCGENSCNVKLKIKV